MKKIVLWFLGILYMMVIILSTVCLFTMNEYGVCKMGNYSLFLTDNLTGYDNDSLLLVNSDINNVKVNNEIIFYNTYKLRTKDISKVISIKNINKKEKTFKLSNDKYLSSGDLIGRVKDVIELSFLNILFALFTSKIGYLVLVIFPILFLVIKIAYELITDMKK